MKAARHPPLAVCAAVIAIACALSLAAGAGAERTAVGNLNVSLAGTLSPQALPRTEPAPISLGLSSDFSTSDGASLPPLRRIEISLGNRGRLQDRGLPVCPARRIRATTLPAALAACGSARIGRGRLAGYLDLPGEKPVAFEATLVAFNSRQRGRRVVLADVHSRRPAMSFLMEFVLRRSPNSIRLVATLSPQISRWVRLTHFDLTLHRTYRHAGRTYSYLSGVCSLPEELTSIVFPLVNVTYVFATRAVSLTTVRACRVREPASAAERPRATLAPYEPRSPTAVRLVGLVDSPGRRTTYHFEYGPQSCALAPCRSLPSGGGPGVGDGVGAVRVRQEVNGLRPETTYHFRLVAGNDSGSVASGEGTFSTSAAPVGGSCPNEARRLQQQVAFLPDCRAYERVSALDPATRNSADVLVDSRHARSAVDATAFEFSSTTGGGEAQSLPISTDYMALRRPGVGWVVHGITPPQRGVMAYELLVGLQPRYVGEFSPDLSTGVFLSNSPLSAEGQDVRDTLNLYRREDLRVAGPGSYRLLTDAFAPFEVDPPYEPVLAGTSSDFSHVLFESKADLTPEAAGLEIGTRLYEWVDGDVRLVGILPAVEGGGPTLARAGRGATIRHYTSDVISEDGSRVVFTTPPVEEGGAGGGIYLRDDRRTGEPLDDTTVKINQTEREVEDPSDPHLATFWTATPDLSQVFFTTTEALTDDATVEGTGSTKLYRYSADAPAGERLTLLSVDRNPEDGIADAADGVIGASVSGDYVYFVGSNQLLPGGPTAPAPRIFVWHEGTIREVAPLNDQTETRHILGSEGWQGSAQWARVTPDGTHLVFLTEGGAEASGFLQVYIYTADGDPGRLQCASCPRDRTPPLADADFNLRSGTLVVRGDPHLNRAISSDGRYVFFTTAQALAAGDLNDTEDAYRFDTATGLVELLTPGRPGVRSYFLEASPSGDDSFVATRSALLGTDRDGNFDVYDARVGGGFPEAGEEQVACASEPGCRPPEVPTTTAPPPVSATLISPTAKRRPPRHCHRPRHRHGRRYCHRNGKHHAPR